MRELRGMSRAVLDTASFKKTIAVEVG